MEALATAASIAGVLSLAGQTIDGIVKLNSFFSDVSSPSRTIERFLQSLNQLIKLIEDVKSLLSSVAENGADFKIAAIEIQLDDCSKEVYRWLRIAKEHHPAFSTGTKKGFKRFWVAVHKGKVRSISEDVKEYRHEIPASLLVLERAMNMAQSSQIGVVQQSLEIASQDAAIFQQNATKQLMKIDSLEENSRVNLKYSHDSLASLASIASFIAEIERRLLLVDISPAKGIQSKPHGTTNQSPKQPKKHQMWSFGGSSDGSLDCIAEDTVAANNSPINSRLLAKPNLEKKASSFKEEVARRTLESPDNLDDDVFETDEDGSTENSCKKIQTSQPGKSIDNKGPTALQSYLDSDQSAIYRHTRRSQSSICSLPKAFRGNPTPLAQLRVKCLLEGHSLHHIDEILTSCKIHDPITGLRLSPENTAIRHVDLLALRKRALKNRYCDLPTGSDSKRDLMNKWLFQNLQNSAENAALHRSIMIAGMEEQLDEKAWTRMMVKYWSIDEAATGLEYESTNISTNVAAHSDAGSLNED
ncbi:hypothetical protein B0J14DRAFT_571142 [Halenospora varia]|nr:hypothetical protein B0J14DRAFT_571142 [Halenospora varia]